MKYLILMAAFFVFSAHAEFKPFIGAASADRSGYDAINAGFSVGDTWLLQIDVSASDNLHGLGIAAGRRFDNFRILAGAVVDATFERRSGFVDVGGVPVFDTSIVTPESSPVFVEVGYKGLFIRHVEYGVEYRLKGQRVVSGAAITGFRDVVDSESATYLGYRINF